MKESSASLAASVALSESTAKRTTKVIVEMEISHHHGGLATDQSLSRWLKACLNCNSNNATVEIRSIQSVEQSDPAIARIDGAFETVNTLLDASGALDSEALQRAVYQLRLEIARAQKNQVRIDAAEESLRELQAG